MARFTGGEMVLVAENYGHSSAFDHGALEQQPGPGLHLAHQLAVSALPSGERSTAGVVSDLAAMLTEIPGSARVIADDANAIA